jgi:hypothetical protein
VHASSRTVGFLTRAGCQPTSNGGCYGIGQRVVSSGEEGCKPTPTRNLHNDDPLWARVGGAMGSGQWIVSSRELRSNSSGLSFCRSALTTRTHEGRLKAVKKNENSVTGANLRLSGKEHKASIQQAKLHRPSGPRQVSGAARPGASIV